MSSKVIHDLIPILKKVRRKYHSLKLAFIKYHNPKRYADYLFKEQFGIGIEWSHPRDLNEWINYLAFKTDTREWSRLADKYSVREYVLSKGLGHILIPLYGVWDDVNAIDFNRLPKSFAIKTNCGSGDTILIRDKGSEDLDGIRNRLSSSLSARFGIETAEPHYLRIKPLILAEKLLPPPTNIDYKIWCLHGTPNCIMTMSGRDIDGHTYDCNVYDLEWKRHEEWLSQAFRNHVDVPKPDRLEEMIEYARILSQGFPQVRVDFYHTDEGVYLGEMTFTASCGRMCSFSKEHLVLMGNIVQEGFK